MEPISYISGDKLIQKLLEQSQEAGNARRVFAEETKDEDDRVYVPYSYEIYEVSINGKIIHIEIYWDTYHRSIDGIDILEFIGRKFNSILNIVEIVEDNEIFILSLYWLKIATLCESLNIDYLVYLRFLHIELEYMD